MMRPEFFIVYGSVALIVMGIVIARQRRRRTK